MLYAGLLLLERAVGNDGAPLDAAEPSEREIVALPRDGNGAIGAPSAFVGLALGDDFDEEDVGLRLPDAGELAGAVEVRIFRLGAFGRDRELEFVGRLAADLVELAATGAPFLFFPPAGELSCWSSGVGGNCAIAGTIATTIATTSAAPQARIIV